MIQPELQRMATLAELIGPAGHVAVGAASPVPAGAALLCRARHGTRVTLLHDRRHNRFTDGSRELFDLAAQGRIDVFFLGGVQIDGRANINLVGTGTYPRLTKRLAGSFGSAYLYFVVPRVILYREEHSRRSLVEKVDFVSAPGTSAPGVFRPGGPSHLLTGKALFAFDAARARFRLEQRAPEETVATVKEAPMATALKDPRHKLDDPSLLKDLCYVDGAWVGADSGDRFAVYNPADGEHLADVPSCGAEETRRAIAAADAAFQTWSKTIAKERAAVLRRWYDLLVAHADDLAMLMTLEQGKPLAEAKGEVMYGSAFVEWFAEEAKRVYGDTIPSPFPGRRILALKQPVGVCGMITPWNFPMAMITRKCAPALAVGCTVVIKPAGLTPLTALATMELAERAGMPKGVMNMLTGSSSAIGGELTSSKTVRKLSFTGSTAVGKILLKQCADTVKKVSMELGGHAPFIVFDDADLEMAVEGAIACKFRNAGQTCVCMNRLYVQAGVHDRFAEAFAEKVAELKVGDGTESGVQVGPLIEPAAIDKVEEHIQDALAKGAKVVTGGERHGAGSLFFQPTVLANCTQDMLIAHDETFGPVAPIFRFDTEEEAITMANDSDVGLAGYFYARDLGRVMRVAEALEVGIVGVNDGVVSTEVAPFGGFKESGLGREGSKYGVDDFLEIKYVSLGGIDR